MFSIVLMPSRISSSSGSWFFMRVRTSSLTPRSWRYDVISDVSRNGFLASMLSILSLKIRFEPIVLRMNRLVASSPSRNH